MWYEGIKKPEMFINIDTYFMKDTFKAAFEAVRSTLIGVNMVLKGYYNQLFSIVRPPGHHSGFKSQPHGFSFFNNVAIATEFAIK
jgi:acetoin utilization deacetylase AcuC-like enzyme